MLACQEKTTNEDLKGQWTAAMYANDNGNAPAKRSNPYTKGNILKNFAHVLFHSKKITSLIDPLAWVHPSQPLENKPKYPDNIEQFTNAERVFQETVALKELYAQHYRAVNNNYTPQNQNVDSSNMPTSLNNSENNQSEDHDNGRAPDYGGQTPLHRGQNGQGPQTINQLNNTIIIQNNNNNNVQNSHNSHHQNQNTNNNNIIINAQNMNNQHEILIDTSKAGIINNISIQNHNQGNAPTININNTQNINNIKTINNINDSGDADNGHFQRGNDQASKTARKNYNLVTTQV